MSSHFEIGPEEYERRREGHMQRRRQELVSEAIRANERPDALVVELGCGPGALAAALADEWPTLRFLGLDVEERMVEHARSAHERPNLSFEVVDLQLSAPAVEARVAFSVDVVHHVHDLDAFLRNVRTLLEPAGVWLVIEPNILHPCVFAKQERMRRRGLDEAHFRSRLFRARLGPAGFAVASRRTAFALPGSVQQAPRALATLERAVERVPCLGGSVVYLVRAA